MLVQVFHTSIPQVSSCFFLFCSTIVHACTPTHTFLHACTPPHTFVYTTSQVKAHAAEDGVQAAYDTKLAAFYVLQRKEALAYAVYASTITFLPNSVAAVVLFYGGVLVLSQRMSAGSLVC